MCSVLYLVATRRLSLTRNGEGATPRLWMLFCVLHAFTASDGSPGEESGRVQQLGRVIR